MTWIGERAFYGCSSLTSIILPEGVTSIGVQAFYGCSSLTSITIPENSQLTWIVERAFCGCSSLTSINIPASVTSIESSAFRNCNSLISVVVAEGNKVYDSRNGCNAIIETNSNTLIQGCPTTIIPESVTSIGYGAFYVCSGLTAITIPASVTSIGDYAFGGCSGLISITCYAKTPPTCASNAFDGVYKQTPVYVPADSKTKYWYATGWKEFSNYQSIVMVTSIVLNHTSAALYEGETLMLTANVSPESAFNLSLTWTSSDESVATVDAEGKVTTLAAGVATITATANDGSGVTASCEVAVSVKPEEQCGAPIIDYIDGQVVLTCETEEVQFVTNVVAEGAQAYQTAAFDLAATYTITAYATKEDYLDSETTTVTLCWIDCTEEHADGGDATNIEIPSCPVLIKTDGGVITLTGLAEGTAVAVYDTVGVGYGTAVAENGEATIATTLEEGSTAIVKIGNRSVKVLVK